jgi:hypothetical protein
MLTRNYRMLAIFLVIVLLLACAPIANQPAPVLPTFDPLSINTIIAQTAGAAATQTFVLLPTLTPSPTLTKTPTEVPSSTPTFIFALPTATVPSSTPTVDASAGPFACRVESQVPKNNTGFARKATFNAHWVVLNTGTSTWDSNNADYRYSSGDQLHKAGIYDLPKSVEPGGSIDLVVAMKAPDESGTYMTKWIISTGKDRFCPMNLTIIVN